VSAAIVGVMDSAGVVGSGAVVDVVDVEMIELVLRDVDEDMVEVMVGIISSELVCSVVMDVVSAVVLRLVDSFVDVVVDCSTSVVWVSTLDSDP
jgi:hypothetical protein